MTLKYLLEKEVKQMMRNKVIPAMIVGFPLLMILLFPWAVNFEARNITVSIVNHDHGAYSNRLIKKIDASPSFITVNVTPSFEEGINDVEEGRALVLCEIPDDFTKDLTLKKEAKVYIKANAVDGTQAMLGNSYLTKIVADFTADLNAENISAETVAAPKFTIYPQNRYNQFLDYKTFMLPAFIVMIITMLCGILPALNIVMEKEVGTIQQINVTPISKFKFILSKILPYWVIGLLVLTVCIPLIYLMFGLYPDSSVLLIYFVTFLFIVAMTGMGIIISNYSNTLQQGMFLVLFFILILFLVSGLFTPVASMPAWSQSIAYLNPLTYYIKMMRLLYLREIHFMDILPEMGYTLIFACCLNLWAVLSYKKRT